MAKLTTKKRNKLKSTTFGLPKERKYPMPDKSHARNAKARASQQLNEGNLSAAEKVKIDRKADRILGETTMKKQGRKDKMDEKKGMKKHERKMRQDRQDEREGMEKIGLRKHEGRTKMDERRHEKIKDYLKKM